MTSNQKFTIFATSLALLLLAGAGLCRAQASPPQNNLYALETSDVSSTDAPAPVVTGQAPATAPAPPPAGAVSDDSGWHLTVSPYLWFPGVHGTFGTVDRSVGVHVSAADLLSHFRFGLMGVVEPRYNRLVLPLDVMWVRLADDKALPDNEVGVTSANVKASMFILTPKVGYRIVNREKLKIDALTGFRYWHFGENLQFSPSILGLNFSTSQNWVDPLVGGRIQTALSPKVAVTLAGDIGGWGVGSQLEYQVVGALGYKIKPTWTLQAGYRYLDVNYRSGGPVAEFAMSGVLFGVSIDLK